MVELPLFVNLKPKNLKAFKGEVEMETQVKSKGISGSERQADSGDSMLLGGMTKALAPLAGIVSMKVVLDNINRGIDDMKNQMKEINPALAQQQKLLEKTMGLALLPMSRVMTTMMKPYLMLMMARAKKAMIASKPILEKLKKGEITPEEAMEQLTPIFEETTRIMNRYQAEMESQTQGLAGMMAGYQTGIELLTKDWLAGYGQFVGGFITSLSDMDSKFVGDLEKMSEDIKDTFGERASEEKRLPESIRSMANLIEDDLAKITFGKDLKTGLGLILSPIPKITFASDLNILLKKILEDINSDYDTDKKPKYVEWWDPRRLLPEYAHYNDFILSGGKVIVPHPNDTIIGTKTPGMLGGGRGGNITNNIHIHVTGFMNDDVADVLIEKMTDELARRTSF